MSAEKAKEGEVMGKEGVSAGELVAAGAALTRLENTTQMTVAVQRPRDNDAVLKEALKVLEMSPILVEKAIYSKPVGKDPDTDEMKHAEGLSIRAAEELRRIYGNNSAGSTVLGEKDDEVIIGAVFVDLEKNTRFAAEKGVSKFFTTKKGQVMQHKPDRLYDVVVPAHASKLLREVILRSLPSWLKMEFEAKARELAMKGRLPAMRKKMVSAFASLTPPVTEAMLLSYLKKEALDKVTREDVMTMKGIHTAINEGEISAKETFPQPDKQEGGTEEGKLPLNVKDKKGGASA